jgi:glycosyltransferase involved in cell wall biosynthesis
MRFAFVQPHLEVGGAERQTVELANRIQAAGHEVHVVLHEAKGGLLAGLDGAVNVHDLGLENHLLLPVTASRLGRLIASVGPVVVVAKLWSSILATALAARSVPGACVILHEDLDPESHTEFVRAGRSKRVVMRHVWRHATHTVANSEAVADAMVRAYGLSRRPVAIPPAVDPSSLLQLAGASNNRESQHGVRFVSVGSLIRRKGMDIALDALSKTPGEWDWTIVGDGPERWGFIERVPESLRARVHLVGEVSNPFPIMARSNCLLHLARSEAFGVVILEALALGLQVVASDTVGPVEIAHTIDNRAGVIRIVKSGDVEGARAVIEEIVLAGPREWVRPSSEIVKPYRFEEVLPRWLELAEGWCGGS